MASHARNSPNRRWRRFRALLTGGLVLGIGATMTMASWTDNEYATGSFSTSTFDIQGSTDGGTTWGDHATSGAAATMTFSGVAMSPGSVQYAPFLIRTKPTSIGGTLVLQPGTYPVVVPPAPALPLAPALALRVVLFTGTCAAASFTGSPTFLVGSSSASVLLPAVVASLGVAVAAAGAANVQMCFEISLPTGSANTLQGQGAVITWQVVGTSS